MKPKLMEEEPHFSTNSLSERLPSFGSNPEHSPGGEGDYSPRKDLSILTRAARFLDSVFSNLHSPLVFDTRFGIKYSCYFRGENSSNFHM